MIQQVQCPNCASADVLFVKELAKHLCKQCEQTFKAAPSITPLRIFLSYGHDSNEPLFGRIKADLEKRAHDVWFDKSKIKAGEAAWEQWYQGKLAEIVRVVESDESRRFAGEIEALNGPLKPIQSDARIYNLLKKGFFGRAWLFEAVEKWRQDVQRDSRVFWITGDPGVGKSAFATQLTAKALRGPGLFAGSLFAGSALRGVKLHFQFSQQDQH